MFFKLIELAYLELRSSILYPWPTEKVNIPDVHGCSIDAHVAPNLKALPQYPIHPDSNVKNQTYRNYSAKFPTAMGTRSVRGDLFALGRYKESRPGSNINWIYEYWFVPYKEELT
jgi:hypothetical protein